MKKKEIIIIGAGLSGATVARCLAEAGIQVHVIEEKLHCGGSCHTTRDIKTGILVHNYGAHIFHTDKINVYKFLNKFSEFRDYCHYVKTIHEDDEYSLPINLDTINKKFKRELSPKSARELIENEVEHNEIDNFEGVALRAIGRKLYESFFKGYTYKQWGMAPRNIPSKIFKRLPIRYNDNKKYFDSKTQAVPIDGYTSMIQKMLNHANITITYGKLFKRILVEEYQHCFNTGPIDRWYNNQFGKLKYRTIDFHTTEHDDTYQNCAVINYADIQVPWTRSIEHKYLSPWESHEKTLVTKEFPRDAKSGDPLLYPLRLTEDEKILQLYVELAEKESNMTFLGRLGTYRYIDMDVAVSEAMEVANAFIDSKKTGKKMPVFLHHPLKN